MVRERAYLETVHNAARLFGALVRQGRTERRWTVEQLAERASVSKNTVTKVEHGDPSVALGIAFQLATLVCVPLFHGDRSRLGQETLAVRDRVALIDQRVRPPRKPIDYDF